MCDCNYDNCGCNDECVPCAPVNCIEQAVNDALAQEKETLEGYVDDAKASADTASQAASDASGFRDEAKGYRDQAEVAANTATEAVPTITEAVVTIQETADAVKQMGENLEEQIKNYLDDVSFLPWVYNNGSANGGETSVVISVDGGTALGVASVYVNGNRQHEDLGYTFNSATQTLTLADALEQGDELIAFVSTEVASPDATDINNYRHVAWLYNSGSANGGETTLTPPYTFKLVPAIYHNGARKVVGLHYQPQSNNTITLKFAVAQGDIIQVILGGTPDEFYAQADSIFTTLASNDGAGKIGSATGETIQTILDGKTVQWTAGTVIYSGYQMVQDGFNTYTYLGTLPHTLGTSPAADGGVWSTTNTSGLWVPLSDGALRALLKSTQGAANVNLTYGTVAQALNDYVTPEMFGALGDGSTDDIAAINNALATGKSVRMNPAATYAVSSSLIFPYTAHRQTLEGNGATIKATNHFLMFRQHLADGTTLSDVLTNKNLFNIYGVGTAHAKSVYTAVVQSQFLRISNGTAMNLSAIGFCNGVSLMGNARVINVYADDIRNAAIRGEGENNFFLGLNAGFIAGDVVLIKSNYSYYGNLFCEYAGVSPTDTEEPTTLRDQGAMVSFAQDGQNAIGNIVDTCHCLNFGGAYAVFSGSYNKMTGSLYGGAFVEDRRAKGAGNAIYMAGTYNMIGDVYLDLVYSGIEMHTGSSHCSTGYITVEAKSGYGTYAISINGTTTDCFIRGLRVKRGLTKSADAYLGTDGTNIGELVLENFTQPSTGASPVRVSGANTIDRLYVSQSATSSSTYINVTIQGAAHIRNLQVDGCLGTSLFVADGVVPKLDMVSITPREASTVPPCIFYSTDGTADRRVGMLAIRGGSAVGQPRCNGIIRIGAYLGPSWAVYTTGVAASAIYADPVTHTLT